MTTVSQKDQRLNVRLSSDALAQIKDAAAISQQDLTSFLLGAALDRARTVLAEDRLLRLTPHDVDQLEKALNREPEIVPQLRSLLRRVGAQVTTDA